MALYLFNGANDTPHAMADTIEEALATAEHDARYLASDISIYDGPTRASELVDGVMFVRETWTDAHVTRMKKS